MKRIQVVDRISSNWYKVDELYDVQDEVQKYTNSSKEGWYLVDTPHNREMFQKRHGKAVTDSLVLTRTCVRTTHAKVISSTNRQAASLLQDEY